MINFLDFFFKKRKNRNVKELLELMLRHQNFFSTGLCRWSTSLWFMNLISDCERTVLLDYIRETNPGNTRGHYYWKQGEITPRIEWINQQIEKLK